MKKTLTQTIQEVVNEAMAWGVDNADNFYVDDEAISEEFQLRLINAVKEYNQKTRQFSYKQDTKPSEVINIFIKRQERFL